MPRRKSGCRSESNCGDAGENKAQVSAIMMKAHLKKTVGCQHVSGAIGRRGEHNGAPGTAALGVTACER
jgi:hypothetical protein